MKAVLFLMSASIVLSAATIANAADSGPVKACLVRAQADRAAAIATGTPRAVADRIWAEAVRRCKAKASAAGSVFAFKSAPSTSEPAPTTKGPKLPRLAIAANAEGLTDTFVPKPNNPPQQARGGGTRLVDLIAEGVDVPTLPRCSQPPCLPGSTTMFSPNPEAPEQGTRGNLPRMFAQTIDRHVPPGRRGAPKGTSGGGTRMSVAHYFG